MPGRFQATLQASYEGISAPLPPFPYGTMKAFLLSMAVTAPEEVHVRFFNKLTKEVRKVDLRWRAAAKAVLRGGHSSSPFLRGTVKPNDRVDFAQRLAAWAELTREALRKLVTKFNKAHGERLGDMQLADKTDVSFVRSDLLLSIEALARSSPPSMDAHWTPLNSECPCCLEPIDDALEQPVGASCGHALCGACFQRLEAHTRERRAPMQCPLCRETFKAYVALRLPSPQLPQSVPLSPLA